MATGRKMGKGYRLLLFSPSGTVGCSAEARPDPRTKTRTRCLH